MKRRPVAAVRVSSSGIRRAAAVQSITFSEFWSGAGPSVYNATYGAQGVSFCTEDSGSNYTNLCLAHYTRPAYGDLPQITDVSSGPASAILAAASAAGQSRYSVGGLFTYQSQRYPDPTNQYADGSYVLAGQVAFDLVCLPGNSGTVQLRWTIADGTGGFTKSGPTLSCNGSGTVQTIARQFPYGVQAFELYTEETVPKASQPQFGIDNVQFMLGAHGASVSMQGGAPNPSSYPTTCSGGDPVNCATGALVDSQPVVAVPGRGMGLNFARTYLSSTAGNDGPLGYGWTDSYAMSLSTDAAGNVTIVQENGATAAFTPASGGGYTPAVGVRASLTKQADGSFVLIRKPTQTRFVFSTSGQLLSEADRNGTTTTLTYSNGLLAAVTDPSGRQLTFTYTGSHIATVTDPMGRQVSFSYDAVGNLATVTDPLGHAAHYAYDTNHRLTTVTDPRGGQTHTVYDTAGRVVQQTDPAGLVTTWAYTGDSSTDFGGTTTITDAHSVAVRLVYEHLQLLSSTKAYGTPAAATTNYEYDPTSYGTAKVLTPLGYPTWSTYDGDGNLIASTDANGYTTTYTYDALDDLTSTRLPNGETSTATYDTAGNLTATTDPSGAVTHYSHADSTHPGDVTAVTDPDGRVVQFGYDSYGNRNSVTVTPATGVSETTTWVYDADSDTVCQASASAHASGISCPPAGSPRVAGTSTRVYDAAGRLTSTTDALGNTASYDYDAAGNITATTDAKGNTTTITYDPDGRVLTSTAGANGTAPSTTQASYDLAPGTSPCTTPVTGTVYCTATTDANGHSSVQYYSARGQLLAVTRPGQATSHSYDLDGNRLTTTETAGQVTHYGYDPLGNLTAITYSDGATPNVAYGYDADNRRVSMTDGTGTTVYSYDLDSRLTSVVDGAANTVSYRYNAAGDITTITYPNNQQVTRGFDGARRLVTLTDWLGHITHYSYDLDGNLTNTRQPNGATITTTVDAADQPTGTTLADPTGAPQAGIAYTRDANGFISQETDTGALTGTTNYTYTPQNQLSTAATTNYSYDPAGNPTNLASTSQAFTAANALTTATTPAGTTSYGYDPNGNRSVRTPASGPSSLYQYDQADRLLGAGTASYFTPLPLARIADTSSGSGQPYAGQTLPAGGTLTIQVTGRGGIPTTGATGAVLRVTEKTSSSASTLTVYPAGTPRPATATLVTNTTPLLVPSRPRTTEITLAPGSNGQISIYNSAGTTDIAVDVVGYYSANPNALPLTPITATRLVDTRTGSGTPYAGHTLAAGGGQPLTVQVAGTTAVPADATAVVLAATVLNDSANGTLSIYPAGSTPPTDPSMYVLGGQATTEQLTVPLGTNPAGALTVNNTGTNTADLTLDIVGYYAPTTGTGYQPLTPTRIADTRANSGQGYAGQHLTAGGTLTLHAAGTSGIPSSGATAVIVTITAPTGSSSPTGLTAYPAGATRPTTTAITYDNELLNLASLNDVPATELTVPLNTQGEFTIYNSAGTTDITVDVLGYYARATTKYGYNGDGLRTTKHTASTTTTITWDITNGVPQLLTDGATSYLYGPDGTPAEQIDTTGTTQYYFPDALGSTRALTDQTGATTATYTYGPYGQTTSHTGTTDTPIQYAAGYHDPETGFYYLLHRHYDPTTAQFLTRDPLEAATGQAYTYTNNNPTNLTDPTGLAPVNCWHHKHGGCVFGGVYKWTVTNLDPAYWAMVAYYNEAQAVQNGCSLTTVIGYGAKGVFYAALTGLTGVGIAAGGESLIGLVRSFAGAAEAAGAAGDFVGPLTQAENEGFLKAISDPNKLNHLFGKAQHGFDPLVSEFGSQQGLVEQMYRGLQGEIPATGRFTVERSIGGQVVHIDGATVDGVPRISTAWVVP